MSEKIERNFGLTPTEKFLSEICDKTFLKLWVYPNTFYKKGKEFCDVLVVFEENVFIFSVKEITFNLEKDTGVAWQRWKRKAIDDSIKQINGAVSWIAKCPDKIFLDPNCEKLIPIKIPDNPIIHRIIVAYGAEEACKSASESNLNGSLGISYSDAPSIFEGDVFNFTLSLPKLPVYHVFDSFNLNIILEELDTIFDLTRYFEAKEAAITKYDLVTYCGEEDLLAHYFFNFDDVRKRHFIGTIDNDVNCISIGEGEWDGFKNHKSYKLRKEANAKTNLWDQIIQRSCQNALDGTLMGASPFSLPNAIIEMAKEPRFIRRENSIAMINSINKFPNFNGKPGRLLSSYPSIDKNKRYVFLQLTPPDDEIDYENIYRPSRQAMLEIACGVLKNKNKNLKTIVGIAIDAPKYNPKSNSDDLLLMNCEEWSKPQEEQYKEENKEFRFFESPQKESSWVRTQDFPDGSNKLIKRKLGRNEKCLCGSGKKYKKCCLAWYG